MNVFVSVRMCVCVRARLCVSQVACMKLFANGHTQHKHIAVHSRHAADVGRPQFSALRVTARQVWKAALIKAAAKHEKHGSRLRSLTSIHTVGLPFLRNAGSVTAAAAAAAVAAVCAT